MNSNIFVCVCFCGKIVTLEEAVYINSAWWCSRECSDHPPWAIRFFPFWRPRDVLINELQPKNVSVAA